jgi:hypothetical protein
LPLALEQRSQSLLDVHAVVGREADALDGIRSFLGDALRLATFADHYHIVAVFVGASDP